MNTSFAKKTFTVFAIHFAMLWKESGVAVTPLWKPWNLLHNRFCNFERVTISLYVQSPNEGMLSELMRATLYLFSSEQLQCCAHEVLRWIWWPA